MGFGRRLLCSLAAVCVVIGAIPALALAANASLAYNYTTGAVGRSWGYPTERSAHAAALAACRDQRRGKRGRCYIILNVSGTDFCGAVVRHRREVVGDGFGTGRRFVNGFDDTQRGAITQAGPGHLIATVCADRP
jgi:hypothetical protein